MLIKASLWRHIFFLFLSIINYWPCILLVSTSIMNGTMKITFGKMKELCHTAFWHRHFCLNFYAINWVAPEQRHFAFMWELWFYIKHSGLLIWHFLYVVKYSLSNKFILINIIHITSRQVVFHYARRILWCTKYCHLFFIHRAKGLLRLLYWVKIQYILKKH